MPVHAMRLVTIVCETTARDAVVALLHEAGAHGHSVFAVETAETAGDRPAGAGPSGRIQVEALVTPDACDRLMARLEAQLLPRYPMIAFEADVKVRQAGTFF